MKTFVKRSGVYDAPDLIMEILSSGNSRHDLTTKKRLYERFGVKEYWIIDPGTKESTGFVLEDGNFKLIGHFSEIIKCAILDWEFRVWDSSL